MTPTSFVKIISDHWFKALIVFSIIGILGAIIFRLLTPTPTSAPETNLVLTNKSGNKSEFSGLRFTGKYTQSVTALPIAGVQPSQTTLDYVRNQLIDDYGLQQVSGVQGLWRGENYVLSYDQYNDSFYFYSRNEPLEDTPLGSINIGLETAQNFVKKYFPNLEFVSQTTHIQYLSGHGEYEGTNRETANSMIIPFSYSIQGVPVYFDKETSTPISITINNKLEVQKVHFYPNFYHFIAGEQELPLISLAEALENINNENKASIISAYDENIGQFTIDEIAEGELDRATLEYRADLETGVTYPFYRFSGRLMNDKRQEIFAEIITPAVITR